MNTAIYDSLALLLTYPAEDYQQRIQEAVQMVPLECRTDLEQFAEGVRRFSTNELDELFTRTFDLNPLCSLEMGWHLFGENYERGLVLVRMREQLRLHGLPESTELPDHLTHVLRLVSRMEWSAGADFAGACVLPALEKMLQAMNGKNNPFEWVLQAVRNLLLCEFPGITWVAPENELALRVLA